MTTAHDDNPILVVDDDFVTLALIRKTLEAHGHRVMTYESAREAWDHYDDCTWRAVLSDFYMTGMDGQEFMRTVRVRDKDTPFLFLTANDDVGTAVSLIKLGADDFIIKPVVEDVLVFRVEHAIREREQARLITRIEQERELLQLENRKLVSWRNLYGTKDIAQTQQMIQLLSRNINQAGGFLWIDLLKSEMQEKKSDGSYCISEEVARIALTAAEGQRAVFEFVSYIGDLDRMELNREVVPVAQVVTNVTQQAQKTLAELTGSHARSVSFIQPSRPFSGTTSIDRTVFPQIIHELLMNAVKFSPENSRIFIGFDRKERSRRAAPAETSPAHTAAGRSPEQPTTQEVLEITVRNAPITTKEKDRDGNPVVGIPYDYAELVFDLFYSIDAFPLEIDQEEWRYGTGLFICRHLLHRMDGTISASNGVDYSGGEQKPFVQLLVTLPIVTDEAR